MNDIAIRIEGLCKNYPGRGVLREINLTIDEGECTGLIGVNGAGKTTLMKCMLDFCAVDAGSIRIFGTDHRRAEARGRIAFLSERFSPPYYLTGRDFLKFTAALNHFEYDEERAVRMLATLDLELAALKNPVRQYSRGMGQKLGLASCFLNHRDLMLLDEPMSGLDPLGRSALKKYLATLKQQGRTLFYSTHLLEDVQALCDRVIILHGGTIRYSGAVNGCCSAFQTDSLEDAYLACIGAELS
ncbi:MAG: ABC transporter ATP-binding protein [Gammaproteobacteria bacterium]